MANIIIKSEEQRQHEEYVARKFGAGRSSEDREAVETISRRTQEAVEKARRMEGRKLW